jgi:hypothetical protein
MFNGLPTNTGTFVDQFDLSWKSSTDDEINTDGSSGDDYVFDIYSQSTTSESSSTSSLHDVELPNVKNVQDICEYGNVVLYLLKSGEMLLWEDGTSSVIHHHLYLVQIFVFHGVLMGLTRDGYLVCLHHHYRDSNFWKWHTCSWLNAKVEYLSVSHDGLTLYVELSNEARLYKNTENYEVVDKSQMILGETESSYIQDGDVYINHQHVKSIGNMICPTMDDSGRVHGIHQNDRHLYHRVKWIRNQVIYI